MMTDEVLEEEEEDEDGDEEGVGGEAGPASCVFTPINLTSWGPSVYPVARCFAVAVGASGSFVQSLQQCVGTGRAPKWLGALLDVVAAPYLVGPCSGDPVLEAVLLAHWSHWMPARMTCRVYWRRRR